MTTNDEGSNTAPDHPRSHPPSVDALARAITDVGLPHPLLVAAARAAIEAGDPGRARDEARAIARALLQPVVNATGVLLHTNLGRAPIVHAQQATYTNLELSLDSGERGSRSAHAATLVARACGAEAGLVVNNGAAAVLLALAALARGRGVAVSRSELVEIGGGFRVPEVMAESGARLVEVGTTNRTRLDDFESAVRHGPNEIALALKVHQSNYKIVGFTESVSVAQLALLPVPVVADIGSGLVDAACPWLEGPPPPWLRDEPAVRQTLESGAALVTFSGDKLFGGPQAGVIVGRADLVDACARHPLARALRPGGLVLAALQETALAYLRRDGDAIPFWRLATIPTYSLRERATAIASELPAQLRVEVIETKSVPGGGTLPEVEIESAGLALAWDHTGRLRGSQPPVIARVHEGRTILDLRTVDPTDDAHVTAALAQLAVAPDG